MFLYLVKIKLELMANRYKSKRGRMLIYIVLAIVVLAIASTLVFKYFSSRIFESTVELPEFLTLPELSTAGYMKVSVDAGISGNMGLINLNGGCYQLIANTEVEQADSVLNGLAKKIDVRPNTHDLMKDALDNFGIKVLMVRIDDLKNNTFISSLILKEGNKIVSLDSRPSDAIALAVRTDAPIYIKESLMKSNGKYIC
jgi:bifunctional DNase/RNase